MHVKLTKRVVESFEPKEKEYDVGDSQLKGFLVRVHPTDRKCFYYSYRNTARKRKRIMIGAFGSAVTVEQARDKALDYAGQVAKGIDVQADKQKVRDHPMVQQSRTLSSFLNDRYEAWILESQKSGKITIDAIRSGFKSLLELPLSEITHSVVDQWRVQESKRGIKATTINRKVNALRGALSRAVEWGIVEDHPFKKLKDLKIDKRPKVRYLTEEENERLLATLAQRDQELKEARERGNKHREERGYELLPSLMDCAFADRMTPLVILSLNTGMRRGELFDLQWRDVNFQQQHITLTGEITKSSATRHIPLNKIALETLQQWKQKTPQPEGRVFPANDGGRLDNVKKSWANILKAAQITDFRWHDMRHDFASQLVMKNVPLNTVRELCGHASLDTTLRYAHLAPDHKAEAVALLE